MFSEMDHITDGIKSRLDNAQENGTAEDSRKDSKQRKEH